MNSSQLFDYLTKVSDYIEYSFYKNSSEIMEAIMDKGVENIFNILSLNEVSKGVYQCSTLWKLDKDQEFRKDMTIDITGEMVFITESI